jgi:hypothetical protein
MTTNGTHDEKVEKAIDQVVDASGKLLDTAARPVPRDQHPKHHGCVRAKFVIAPGLGPQYGQGLFAQSKIFDAWIRFSNGGQHDDRQKDAHGMAVKLMAVEGEKSLAEEKDATTHDFVMVDNPIFFLRDAIEYGEFTGALLKAKGKEPSTLYNLLGILGGKLRELATVFLLFFIRGRLGAFARLIKFVSKLHANPLSTRYWSTTPYQLGNASMKFSAVPAELPAGVSTKGPEDLSADGLVRYLQVARAATPAPILKKAPVDSPNYLREALAGSLKAGGTVFLFQIQAFVNDQTTPVNDPTVEWPESAAPFRTVAWIWIPPQVPDTPKRMDFCQHLSFTPWHALKVHEPQGEINLVRRKVYRELSLARHQANGRPMMEPDASFDPDAAPPTS